MQLQQKLEDFVDPDDDHHGLVWSQKTCTEYLLMFVAEMGVKPSSQSCESELIVVTGRGRHSHQGVARLRPAVIAYLNANHYQYVISLLRQHLLAGIYD